MTADTCALCGEPLDQDGQCVACDAWAIEPFTDEELALLYADLTTMEVAR